MDPLGLVVLDDQIFLNRVANRGMEQGIFTRDRADEIIRISVAMANKYVLTKEVDFRSTHELAKVQETILKLVGVGLEIKSDGDVEEGVRILMSDSPVDLFRLAYTRIEKLRDRWALLLKDHRVEILVSPEEYETLSDLASQRLTEMSIFTEQELETIRGITLSDELFPTLAVVTYYESELERYEFILRMRDMLPFQLLNASRSVHAENLSEVDSIREALINTLIISGCVDSENPVSVTMADVRRFLETLGPVDSAEIFPPEYEEVVLDLIHELAEDLNESDASRFTSDVVQVAQNLIETVMNEWDTLNSPSENTFFKRWCRLAIIADAPDVMERILSTGEQVDEFDFEIIVEQLAGLPEDECLRLVSDLPWKHLTNDQVIRLFQEFAPYQPAAARKASLEGFTAAELVDLLEVLRPDPLKILLPELKKAAARADFTMEDLDLVAALPHKEITQVLRAANPPSDYEPTQIVAEFSESSDSTRRLLLYTCWGTQLFPELIQEAILSERGFVAGFVKKLSVGDVGPFFESAAGTERPRLVRSRKTGPRLGFSAKHLTVLFDSLPPNKKKAALKYFGHES
jgi:hypothetical protein